MKTLTKKMIVILIAIFCNFQLYSQTENSVVVSADKMKILYVGLDNPVSIAASGISSDKLKVTITNGTITGSNGKYIVKPGHDSISIIMVATELKPGEIIKVGCDTFKVKHVPVPVVCIGNYNSNAEYLSMSKDELLKNSEINVPFDIFDLKFNVISFTFSWNESGMLHELNIIGNKFDQKIIDVINKTIAGDKLFIENIKVTGPGGIRTLPAIIIKIVD